jgi:prepilin-type N-terminal cleavage/methylation domain-containing protein
MKMKKIKVLAQSGFSLVELMIVVAILSIVFAVVADSVKSLQNRNTAEVSKLDIVQSARDFLDQSTRDIHQAGYPTATMLAGGPACAGLNTIACGLTSVSANQIIFEGDTNGDGTVESETIQVIGADGNLGTACPCTVQRGSVPKGTAGAPPYYAELGNLTSNAVFSFYDKTGTLLAAPFTLANIKTVRITVTVQGNDRDPTTKQLPMISMTAQARISN